MCQRCDVGCVVGCVVLLIGNNRKYMYMGFLLFLWGSEVAYTGGLT